MDVISPFEQHSPAIDVVVLDERMLDDAVTERGKRCAVRAVAEVVKESDLPRAVDCGGEYIRYHVMSLQCGPMLISVHSPAMQSSVE